ncbi:MAG: hypothetical protein ACKOET_06100 [Verrucomicrobiota bacterium]
MRSLCRPALPLLILLAGLVGCQKRERYEGKSILGLLAPGVPGPARTAAQKTWIDFARQAEVIEKAWSRSGEKDRTRSDLVVEDGGDGTLVMRVRTLDASLSSSLATAWAQILQDHALGAARTNPALALTVIELGDTGMEPVP